MYEPMILLHGVGLDRTVFKGLQDELPMETHAYDYRGSGDGPDWKSEASLGQLAQDLWKEADEKGWDRFALCGFSFGAMIAQYAALDRPERISHLILLNAVFNRTELQRDAVRARLQMAQREGTQAIIEAALSRWFTEDFAPQPLVAATRSRLEGNSEEQFLKNYALFAEGDAQLAPRVAEIDCPVFVATGALDQGSTPEMSKGLADAIPNGVAKIYDRAAHFLPLQFPKELARDIVQWMEET